MHTRAADLIRETLEQDIVTGVYGDGTHLDEIGLAERFEVSRTPVREAFQMLASSGLVELKPRRGAFVIYPDIVAMVEMFEVMAELEGMACRLAARRANARELAAISGACDACEAALREADSDTYYRENELFHHALYRASGNDFLEREATKLHRRLQAFRRLQLRVRGRLDQSMAEHRAILRAISEGDALTAERRAKEHILIQGEKFNDLMAGYRKVRDPQPA